ncbi:response regulator [Kordia sp. YSTF-M3]|uniref:histidine kinase n=1 Tax=Kordia aestuariivivens TaxID=2759037 RepID=A0ABR7Q876_9FLAO|nr:response regulator [Kordia aestuariivivens]MBC8754534.1 response regulator [Kordia aestuariivivens]
MKNTLPTILCIFLSFSVWSQKSEKEKIKDSIQKYFYITGSSFEKYQYIEAIEAANKGITFAHQINDIRNLATLHNDLGLAYNGFSEFTKSKENYLKSLVYAAEENNDTLRCWVYNNLGNIYSEGYKNTDSALYYYKESLKISEKLKDTAEILTPILNIGWTYIDEEKFDTAYPYLVNSEKMIYTKHGDKSAKAQISYLLGRYFLAKENYELADTYYKTAINFAEEEKLLDELTEIYQHYSALAEKQGKPEVAYDRLRKHLKYKDSLFNEIKIKGNQDALVRFSVDEYKKDLERSEIEKRDQQIIIDKTKQISYVLMIAGFILILLLINMFKNYKFRNKALTKLRLKNSELREAKEEAEEQAKLKSQFFSTVSHELRTPLYGVVGLTSLLSEDFPNLKENENFKSLKFSSKYLLSLINNVLQINKIESEGVKLGRIPFNIKSLVSEVVNSFSFALNQNENKVHQKIDPKIPEVLIGDSVRLSQILINLIGNAIKFTESGNIWVELTSVKQENLQHTIQFSIKDDGIGIPKEKQEKVFDKFIQLRPIEKNYQGTGLGLSIVKRLLLLFESDITLKSEHKEGTEFTFDITFEESKEMSIKDTSLPINVIDNIDKKILIVDDNKINQVITKRILQTKGYQCDVAEDGFVALELAKSNEYDLILMDINMPKIDGIETTKRIRLTDKNTPIIALTAVEEDQIKDEIYEAGMNDFIIKPYDLEEFHQIILKSLYVNVI